MYNLIELLVWGKKSNTYKRLFGTKRRSHKTYQPAGNQMYLVLPRDVAISVLNDGKSYAVER